MEQRVQTSAAPGPATDEMEQARYNCVLRSIFGEIFEVDFSGDSYRLIHMGDVRFCPPPPGMGVAATLRAIAETLIHPEDREIFLRYYYYLQPAPEIAEAMRLTPGAVRTRLSRGRAALKKRLSQEELLCE